MIITISLPDLISFYGQYLQNKFGVEFPQQHMYILEQVPDVENKVKFETAIITGNTLDFATYNEKLDHLRKRQ